MRVPPFTPTLVGSLPHCDVAAAAALVTDLFPEMTPWPQLAAVSHLEQMYAQTAVGFPGAKIGADGRVTVQMDDRALGEADSLLSGKGVLDDAALPEEAYHGLFAVAALLSRQAPPRGEWFKGQVTGPISFALSVTGDEGRSILYDPLLREVAVAHVAARARLVARVMREREPRRTPVIFLDEPSLSTLGSAFLPLERGEAGGLLRQVVEGADCPVGIHCCGNTDWGLVMDSGAGILNLDAFTYGDSLTLYPRELRAFLERGGRIAWGIVPTDREPDGLDASSLADRLVAHIDSCAAAGIDKDLLAARSMITPACGMGTRTVGGAETIARLAAGTAELMRERFAREVGG